MQLIQAVILVCSTAVAPADCRPETALDFVMAPEASGYAFCGLQAQAFMANSALAPHAGDGRYLKILCRRERTTAVAGVASEE